MLTCNYSLEVSAIARLYNETMRIWGMESVSDNFSSPEVDNATAFKPKSAKSNRDYHLVVMV